MNVFINGESRNLPDTATLQDVIELLQLSGRRLAIEVNTEIIPKSRHSKQSLQENDRIEIVHAIGGGCFFRSGDPK